MADRALFFLTSFLIGVGVLFSYSLSTFATLIYGYNEFHFLIRQFITAVFAIFIMWGISRLDPDKWFARLGFFIFFLFLLLMIILPFLPESLATSAGGAKRWIRLPLFSLTPVEFFKVGFIFFLSWSFSRKLYSSDRSLQEEFLVFLPYFFVFLMAVALIAVMQNDLGQVVVLGLTLIFLALFAGTSLKFFLVLSLGGMLIFVNAIIFSEHRIFRIKQWWAVIQDMVLSVLPSGFEKYLRVDDLPEPYQIYQSLNAIKNGGFFGEGLGNGVIKLGFLSEVHTDIVLAGIVEETGFLGLLFVTLIIFVIIFRVFKIANRSENRAYHLFCVGVGMLISFSFLINALGISGITPVKGIAVPFLSYGGSSMLANAIAIGIVLSVAKKAKL